MARLRTERFRNRLKASGTFIRLRHSYGGFRMAPFLSAFLGSCYVPL